MTLDRKIAVDKSHASNEGEVSALTDRKNELVSEQPQGQAGAKSKSIIRRPMQALAVIGSTEARGKWKDRFNTARTPPLSKQ